VSQPPENPEVVNGPLNEWLFDEYIRVKDALADLTRRHEEIVNTLADICRRNDRMQAAGDALVTFLSETPVTAGSARIDELIQKWGEANV